MVTECIHCIAKKEAKRLEKLAKAATKTSAAQSQAPKKEKAEKKEKKAEAPAEAWVNTTPKGEKKGQWYCEIVAMFKLM